MSEGIYNFTSQQKGGTIKPISFTFTISSPIVSARIKVKKLGSTQCSTSLYKMAYDLPCVVSGSGTIVTTPQFTPAQTEQMTLGDYFYDIEVTLENGIVQPIIKGKIPLDTEFSYA